MVARRRRGRHAGRVDGYRHARHQRRAVWQLAASIAALVVLLALWSHLSDGAAGCFGAIAPSPSESVPGPEPRHDAVDDAPPPEMRVKRPGDGHK
jgi:hypothetical protein